MLRIELVRERGSYGSVRGSREAFELFRGLLRTADREHFAVALMNAKMEVIGVNVVSVGNLTQSLVHPRETFKAAILANASSVILAHNHPSGDPSPSDEDRRITARLRRAGDLLGIAVADHIVLGEGRYYSFADEGRMNDD